MQSIKHMCQKCKVNEAEGGISMNKGVITLCPTCLIETNEAVIEKLKDILGDDPFTQQNAQSMLSEIVEAANQAALEEEEGTGEILVDAFGGKDLTAMAKNEEFDPIIGRDDIIEQVIETLSRKTKNNPILLGEPAVGKTSIIEGLAQRIASGEVPAKSRNKKVISFTAADLQSGLPPIPGAFETKMKALVEEVASRDDVIIFMDEIHQLVSTGFGSAGMDAGNILKPQLARGKFPLIGATTFKEYRKFIEKDAALERRFNPITIGEPMREEAIAILNGIVSRYEAHHGITYGEGVIEACVDLSTRYMADRKLPDKAIDLLDTIGSKLGLHVVTIEQRIAALQVEMEEQTKKENYLRANSLKKQIKELSENENLPQEPIVATVADVQTLVELKTGIPITRLEGDKKKYLITMNERVAGKVIGQSEAVDAVADAVKLYSVGLKKDRPLSFLFVGPTGVGKTELAKVLAEDLFNDRNRIIRFDMSEFGEKHSVSRLIGSPPGYIGHGETGELTEAVRRNPFSIVLLDEIEKAHPDVFNIFLQVLEDGHLTDSQGRKIIFKDTIVIATSNAGVGMIEEKTLGFHVVKPEKKSTRTELTQFFRPEILNRFDSVVKFNPLETKDLEKIVDLMMDQLRAELHKKGITLNITDPAKKKLAELGYDPANGARPLRRVIQKQVEEKIALGMLHDQDTFTLSVKQDNLNLA